MADSGGDGGREVLAEFLGLHGGLEVLPMEMVHPCGRVVSILEKSWEVVIGFRT